VYSLAWYIHTTYNKVKNVYVADAINPDVVVSVGEKLNLRCQQNFNSKTTWYKDDEALHKSTNRIRINKQLLKFKSVELEDTGVYSCKLESNETIYWRNVTVRVENLQNDGFQTESEDKSAMNILRPEDGDNDLEMETRSELSDNSHSRILINLWIIISDNFYISVARK